MRSLGKLKIERLKVKKYIFILLAGMALVGCQVIPEDERLIEVPMTINGDIHPHVLIEYTGFRCVNCPLAAEQAHDLQQLYGNNLIVVAMHPASNPFTQGVYDYTCPASDIYYQFMGGTATTPFPTGNIDMMEYENNYLIDYTTWPALIKEQMSDITDIRLQTTATLDAQTRDITISTTAYAGEAIDVELVLWLTEDSITGAQLMPDGTPNMEYTHNHVLRAAAGEPWGKSLSLSTMPTHDTTTLHLPDQCNAANCHIVALIIDKDDKHILNATETKIQ